MFASALSSAKTTRVWATGRPRSRQKASSPTVASIASWILPPPNFAGSVKPLTKSTMSKAAFLAEAEPVTEILCLVDVDVR